jgi:Tol biopolymer transport system component
LRAIGGSRVRAGAVAALLCAACGAGPAPRPSSEPQVAIERVPRPARVSDAVGPMHPSLDGDCRRVAFALGGDLWVHDLVEGRAVLASTGRGGGPANRPSGLPILSEDGRRLLFDSAAGDLVPGEQNRHDHVFMRDLATGAVERVSVNDAGEQADGPNLGFDAGLALSGDGQTAVWSSHAAKLVPGDRNGRIDVFARDLAARRTRRVSLSSEGDEADGDSHSPATTRDGRLVAFASSAADLVAGDTNGVADVFLHDRHTGRTWRASLAAGGVQADGPSDLPALSADGRVLAFASEAGNLAPVPAGFTRGVFVLELATGRVELASAGAPNGQSDFPALSADGARVAFVWRSDGGAGVAGDEPPLVLALDRPTGRLARVSAPASGAQPDEESGAWGIAIGGDGTCVAFTSLADNLVPGDGDRRSDLFVARIRW